MKKNIRPSMQLDRIILSNFKNYAEADVSFCPKVNCLVGDNGAGKTNLLDAIYYLSFCKSYFNPIDSQNIRQGCDFFAIHGHYGDDVVSCIVRNGSNKQMRLNKKVYKTLSQHIGRIPLVMISPTDQMLITGGSEVRRRFLDGVISQQDNLYLNHLMNYNKALDQRNRLLKQMWLDRMWEPAMVEMWDAQLCLHGNYIYDARRRFVDEFRRLFVGYYADLTSTDEACDISYEHDERELSIQLYEARQADRYAQHTTVGPHRDDIILSLTPEMPVRRFGSQGQQKSFALAMKLAQFRYLLDHTATKPILLLDDIFDKLDLTRIHHLLTLVGSDLFGQVFLTDTQPGRVQDIFRQLPSLEHLVFNVTKGAIVDAE